MWICVCRKWKCVESEWIESEECVESESVWTVNVYGRWNCVLKGNMCVGSESVYVWKCVCVCRMWMCRNETVCGKWKCVCRKWKSVCVESECLCVETDFGFRNECVCVCVCVESESVCSKLKCRSVESESVCGKKMCRKPTFIERECVCVESECVFSV